MAQTYGFFNSVGEDRKYNADQMSEYFDGLVSNGVYEDIGGALQVIASTGMNVQVKSGRALIDCKWFKSDAVETLAITQSHPTLNRYTAIVLKLDYTNRNITLYAKDGTPASSAKKPSMTVNTTVKELCLAYVYIKAGTTSISQSNITDMRASSLCGWVTGIIKQVDTSQLFLQWEQAYEEYYQSFVEWFATLTDTLNVNTYIKRFRVHTRFMEVGTHVLEIYSGVVLGYVYDANDVFDVYINGLLGAQDIDYTVEETEEGINIIPVTEQGGAVIDVLILKSIIGDAPSPTPTPPSALYDWDFTQSLEDGNGTEATFFTDIDDPTSITTTPASGQFVQGTGLVMGSNYALQIPVNMLSKTTSYAVEIDFANCTMGWNSWNFGFLRTASIDGVSNLIVSGLNGDFNSFSVDVTDANGGFNYTEAPAIDSQTYWANSTMKVVNRLTANNNVVWDFYKDDTLIFTTNEYETDGETPMFWDNVSVGALFAIDPASGAFTGTITGMRISEVE